MTLYPGQTAQIPIALASDASGIEHPVTLGASSLPQGIALPQTTGQTGSSAMLTITAPLNAASYCFVGNLGVDSVTVPMTLTAASGTGETTVPVSLQITLENPAFVPATMALPVLAIQTQNSAPIADTENYITSSFTITDAADSTQNYSGTGVIKGHGNSTWQMPKKPYTLKLDSKAGLLGMKKAKKWILLANYDDKSMLRTSLAFTVSNLFNMVWTPSTQFVEVTLNGAYQGVYQLSEPVEIDPNRLNIAQVGATTDTMPGITGGYLLEVDAHQDEDFVMHTPRGLPIGGQDPDPPDPAQESYLETTIGNDENILFSNTYTDPVAGWPAYFDQTSFVDWYLTQELMGNVDSPFYSSVYIYKLQSDNHIYMGPVWDFDVSSGNVNYQPIVSPTVLWVRQALWYQQLFTDPNFLAAVKARWTAIRPQLSALPAYLDSQAALLNSAQTNNFGRWPILQEEVWPNSEVAGTYQGEVNFLKSWITQRIAYLDTVYLNP